MKPKPQFQKKSFTSSTNSSKKGLVLIIALALLVVIALVATIVVNTTNTDIKISGNYKSSVQAFYIADAGIEHARATLGIDLDPLNPLGTLLENPPTGITATSLGNGTYTVFVTDNGDDGDGDLFADNDDIVILTSYGSSTAGHEKVIEATVTQERVTNFSVFAGGDMDIEDDVTINGDIFSVGAMTTENDSIVNGNVSTSSNNLTTDGTVNGNEASNVQAPPTPTLDFDAYMDIAVAVGTSGDVDITDDPPGYTLGTRYINGDLDLTNLTVTDSLIYVTGEVQLKQVNLVNSSIIADGNIDVEGQNGATNIFTPCTTCIAGGPFPLFATKDELTIKGDPSDPGSGNGIMNLAGLIYADGKIVIEGPGDVNIVGAVVSTSGDVKIRAGNMATTVTFDPTNLPLTGILEILSWREVY